MAYSAKLYTLLANQLRSGSGPVAIGPALVNAKQAYLAGVSSLTGIDQKALIESTLYGLPMTGLNLPAGRTTAPVTGPGIRPTSVATGTPGDVLGLKTAPFDVTAEPHAPPLKPVLDTRRQFHRRRLPLADRTQRSPVRAGSAGVAEADRRRDQRQW